MIMKDFEEKQTILRWIAALKKKNEIAIIAWKDEIRSQVEQLKIQE